MIALFCLLLTLLASPFKSKSRLEAENAALRRQLLILRRKVRGRVRLKNGDRLFFIQLYRWFPSILKSITIVRPETLVRWHRAGFRRYWRWKSRSLGGRPHIDADLRALIRRMSLDNPLWGAPRIHGELLKLGFAVAQSSVAKYMVKRSGPPSQGWRTFLCNHAPDIAAMDFFVAPTIGFDLLYVLVIIRLARRNLAWINATLHPTAEWIARQIREAFPAFHQSLIGHHRHDTDRSKSGKSKGACTGLGQINAAAFNIRPSVRDRDRDGMTILLVGDLDFGTKGQRFVRRRHVVIVERDAASSFGSRLRRATHGVHRCDTVFGTNWNVEQTQYERGDQLSHA